MCQKEINAHRPEYNNFCSTGQLIIEETPGSLGNKAARELDKVTRQWTMITNRVTSNQQQLELSLKDWQEYTSLTENLMVWLREKEKVLRAQSKALTVRDVERELGAMKVTTSSVILSILNGTLMRISTCVSSFEVQKPFDTQFTVGHHSSTCKCEGNLKLREIVPKRESSLHTPPMMQRFRRPTYLSYQSFRCKETFHLFIYLLATAYIRARH